VMLASQITSIQEDITSITNVGSSILSAGKAQAALAENTKVTRTALTQKTATAQKPPGAPPQSTPIRLDMTGAFVDTVA
jgi:hypothetical protein